LYVIAQLLGTDKQQQTMRSVKCVLHNQYVDDEGRSIHVSKQKEENEDEDVWPCSDEYD
jgi:hypothetical protein